MNTGSKTTHIGTSLNQYQITARVGAGGMGEVFRARDTRLNRDVAVKVLPKDFVADADRLRRFEQEAKTLAALNHPNVLTIHDAGVHEGAPYLVSELLEGRTLREEMNGGALPVRKAKEYALQIAHGLAAAHSKGVVHRDLKPENIFVTKDGRVKILDFGLAKLRNPSPVFRPPSPLGGEREGVRGESDVPTIRIDADPIINTTEPGMVLGTPAYMSPEQVRGEPADHRADIFAFGCVLYEMLSGTRAFRRDTPVETMNAVLNEELVDLSASNASVPPSLERVVRRCLEKQPDNRFQSAKDLAFAIENAGAASSSFEMTARSAARSHFNFRAVLPWAVAALCLAGFLIALLPRKKSDTAAVRSDAKAVRKFELTLPQPAGNAANPRELHLAISPDGKKLAYADAEGLWLRWLGRVAPPVLLTAGRTLLDPFWSPQSTDIGFFDGRKLYRISLDGGQPTLVGTAPQDPKSGIAGCAWLPGGRIIFATGMSALYEVPEQGGKVTTLLALAEGELDFHHASALPAGRGVLFVVHGKTAGTDTIAVWTPAGQRKVVLHLPGTRLINPVFSPTGHILYQRADVTRGLWAFAFSLATLERTREPFRVSDVGNQLSVADDAMLVFSFYEVNDFASRQLIWLDRSGKTLETIGPAQPGLSSPRLSPDGRRIVAVAGESPSGLDVRIVDVAGGGAIPFTRNEEKEDVPLWWSNGRTVLFTRLSASGAQVIAKPADGAGQEQLLFDGAARDLSRSGKYLLVTRESANGKITSGYVSMADPQRRMVPLPETLQRFYWMRLSPDERLLAYHSPESGNDEVYVMDFPAFTQRRVVSRGYGRQPEWHPKGTELFYFGDNGRSLLSARLKPSGESFEEPEKLFDLPESIYSDNPWRMSHLDISPQGDRFLMLRNVPDHAATNQPPRANVLVVMNWFEEFREKK